MASDDLVLAAIDAATLESIDRIAQEIAETDCPDEIGALLILWAVHISVAAEQLLDETGGQIH